MRRNSSCMGCSLGSSTDNVGIIGSGPSPCQGMVILDYPGYNDYERILNSKSGKILRQALADIGLPVEKLFVAHAVCCRPPQGKKPGKAEIQACNERYLSKLIAEVNPRAVLLMGNVAYQSITGKKGGITKAEGTAFTKDGVTYVPSRSTSSLVHLEGQKEMFFAMQKLRENLLLFKRMVDPREDSFAFIDPDTFPTFPDGPVYIDYETNGLSPYRLPGQLKAKVHCIGMQSIHEDKVYSFPVEKFPDEKFQDFFRKHPIIPHRGTFEGMWTLKRYRIMPKIYFDTKVGAFVMNESEPTGLKYQAIKHLGVEPWVEEQDFIHPDWDKMLPYNARDTNYGCRLYREVYKPFLKKHPKIGKLLKYIIFPAEEVFTRVIHKGFHINMEDAQQKLSVCDDNLKVLNAKIDEIAGHHVNPGSPKQMNQLFYKDLGLKCPVFTKKNAPSTSEAALIRLAGKHPIVDIQLDWRKWKKYKSTYLVPWMTRGPVLHANYGFTNTDTGRLNSTMLGNKRGEKKLGANLHQCPRDKFVRNLITARDPDWCIVAADLSQAELRLVAHVACEPTMIEIFNAGLDIHLGTAMDVLGVSADKIEEETRKKAKAVNFGFVYGMWAKKFMIYAKEKFGLELTLREAERYREGFFDKYAGLEPWYNRVEAQVSRNGWIDSIFGRRRHLPDARIVQDNSPCPDCRENLQSNCFWCGGTGFVTEGPEIDEWIRNRAVRQAINSPIQSAASDLNLFIAALVASEFYKGKWKYRVDMKKAFCVGSAHDSLIWECHRDYVKELKFIIQSTVKELPVKQYFGFEFRVPILMDVDAYEDCWKGKKMVI